VNANSSTQRLLLNHISTPHVTIASAVAASCALPGVMAPRTLEIKNSVGEIIPVREKSRAEQLLLLSFPLD
jgi:predicted acylesterase/phospholipase RssA